MKATADYITLKTITGAAIIVLILAVIILVNYAAGKKDIMAKSMKRHNY